MKAQWIFYNLREFENQYRSYEEVFIDLEKRIKAYQLLQQEKSEASMAWFTDMLVNFWSNTDDPMEAFSSIPWVEGVFETWDPMSAFSWFDVFGWELTLDFNFDVSSDLSLDIQKQLDKLIDWLCQWFKIGGGDSCGWLPIPFNMDFLTPGNFNIFGCPIKPAFWGLPIFAFPWTFIVPALVPVPTPSPIVLWYLPPGVMKWPWDTFLWLPGWIYPSMVRVYLTPTLTMQMWLAVCMWPMSIGNNFPKLIWDMGWNCIVMALSLPCAEWDEEPDWVWDGPVLDDWMKDVVDLGTCNSVATRWPKDVPWIDADVVTSPFEFVSAGVSSNYPTPVIPPGSYVFGMLEFDTVPTIEGYESEWVGWIELKGWDEIKNKNLWGMANWLVKCIVQDWLDRQIKYVLNNMTKMTIGIIFPDFSDIFAGFDKITVDNLAVWDDDYWDCDEDSTNYACELEAKTDYDERAWYIQDINKQKSESKDPAFFDKLETVVQNNILQKEQLSNASNKMSNPFEALAAMFEEVELINLNTEDINIKVPFIYSEDIISYMNYLQSWLQQNKIVVRERDYMFKWVVGYCARKDIQDVVDPQNIKENYQKMLDNIDELPSMSVLKKNLEKELSKTDLDKSIRSLMEKDLNNLDNQMKKNVACAKIAWNTKLSNFIKFKEDSSALIASVEENIRILESYKKFPLELYEWIHVFDRYLSELSSIVSGFVWTITRWMNDNAERYSSYVDSIVLMMASIKTWQALIDLSVDWSQKCSKCTTDTYDSYSCKLSFICPDLPIIPVPPFKIPSVFIDLSHIDMGMEITLPEFNFVPVSVDLPRFPNLPNPPTLDLNYNFESAISSDWSFDFDLIGKVNMDFGELVIPSIPILPAPPDLPDLPSFLPTVNLELPVLPPAPEVPKIMPEVEVLIGLADRVWQILCILKGNIGLVAENALKSKVEQLTQRTWNVPFFDYFDQEAIKEQAVAKRVNDLEVKLDEAVSEEDKEKYEKLLTIAKFGDAPLKWFDYQIDSYVHLQYNFDHVYEYINVLAEEVNGVTTVVQAVTQTKINILEQDMANWTDTQKQLYQENIIENVDKFQDQLDERESQVKDWTDLKTLEKFENMPSLWFEKFDNWTQNEIEKLQDLPQEQIEKLKNATETEIEQLKKKLSQQSSLDQTYAYYENTEEAFEDALFNIQYVRDNAENENVEWEMNNLLALFEDKEDVNPSVDAVKNIQKQVGYLLTNYKEEVQDFEEVLLHDYDWFLASLENNGTRLVASDKKEISYSVPILQGKNSLPTYFAQQDSPEDAYLKMNKQRVDGYLNAISSNKAEDLDMSETVYNQSRNYLLWLQKDIDIYLNADQQFTENSESCLLCDIEEWDLPPMSVDIAAYIDGIFIKNHNDKITNIVNSDTQIKSIADDYFSWDINNDQNDDVIMRDSKSIYIKYADQDRNYYDGEVWISDDEYYKYDIDNIEWIWSNVSNKNWYANIGTLRLKLLDENWEVKNFVLKWQSFENLKFSWSNSKFAWDDPEVYVLKFNQRVDTFYDDEQEYYSNSLSDAEKVYVLVLPKWTENITWYYVDFEDGIAGQIASLMTWTIVDIKYYDPFKSKLSVTLTEMPRAWVYPRIATMKQTQTRNNIEYVVDSPWSNQLVAWRQLLADIMWPEPEITLHRILADEIISTGINHEGYVSTYYTLQSFWEDNVAVDYMWIEKDGVVLSSWDALMKTWLISLTGLFFTWSEILDYRFGAVDFDGNMEIQDVQVSIKIPGISILSIDQLSEDTANVIAEIDHDMDEWAVIFDRERHDVWEYLSGTNDDVFGGYDLVLWQTVVTWWVYSIGNELGIFNEFGVHIWSIDPDNWYVYIFDEYLDEYDIDLDFEWWIPRLRLFNKINWHTLFWITLPTEELISWELHQWLTQYDSVLLDDLSFWDFYGWSWFVSFDEVVMYVGPLWELYIPSPANEYLNGTYEWDYETELVSYHIMDQFESDVLTVIIKTRPFLD